MAAITALLLVLLAAQATFAAGAAAGQQGCQACPLHDSTVCGQDGLEYQNECLAVCQGVDVRHKGPCNQQDQGTGTAEYRSTEGEVTWLEMSDMHQQGYKLIGRHKLAKWEKRAGDDGQRRKQQPANRPGAIDGQVDRRHVAISYLDGDTANIYMRAEAHPMDITAGADNPPYFPAESRKLLTENVVQAARSLLYNGEDDRSEITSAKSKPWKAVTLYTYNVADGRSAHCTAAMIGPAVALTAGHCVYDPEFGGYMNNQMVYPGASGGKSPMGGVRVTRAEAFGQWVSNQDDNWDLAVLYLEKTIGYKTGWFGTQLQCGEQSYTVTLAGYPKDKPDDTMWEDSCSITMDACSDAQIEHMCYTMGGNSGSPLFDNSKSAYIRAVHMSTYDYQAGNWAVNACRREAWSLVQSAIQSSKR